MSAAKRRAAALAAGKSPKEAREAAQAVWNGWAEGLLAGKAQMERAGAWQEAAKADFSGVRFVVPALAEEADRQGGIAEKESTAPDEPTRLVLIAGNMIDFWGFLFPGDADFYKAEFRGTTEFQGAEFNGGAWFSRAQFHEAARFDFAQFNGGARFEEARFSAGAGFGEAEFRGLALFRKAQFSRGARFGMAQFSGDAQFDGVKFSRDAQFGGVQFNGIAWFGEAQFSGQASFDQAKFNGDAAFEQAQFSGEASFVGVRAAGKVGFNKVQFSGDAIFGSAQFSGGAGFEQAQFGGEATFEQAQFSGDASFSKAQFNGIAVFEKARFSANASFRRAQFAEDARFARAWFSKDVTFFQASFDGLASFREARFKRGADFTAIQASKSAFTLARADFAEVPDFTQAHFQQPPRFDNITIAEPLDRTHWKEVDAFLKAQVERRAKAAQAKEKTEGTNADTHADAGKSLPSKGPQMPSGLRGWLLRRLSIAKSREAASRFRTLKRWATAGHDHENEIAFFAHEMRARRFWVDSPTSIRQGAARFWFGWLYEKVSDFGRSLIRPLVTWGALILIFALFYLLTPPAGSALLFAGLVPLTLLAVLAPFSLLLLLGAGLIVLRAVEPPALGAFAAYVPTGRCVDGATDGVEAALDLSLKNAFVVLDWQQSDAARRALGCLYGFTTIRAPGPGAAGDAVLANTPFTVSLAATLQSLLSAALIFLFLLALRNLLRLK